MGKPLGKKSKNCSKNKAVLKNMGKDLYKLIYIKR